MSHPPGKTNAHAADSVAVVKRLEDGRVLFRKEGVHFSLYKTDLKAIAEAFLTPSEVALIDAEKRFAPALRRLADR